MEVKLVKYRIIDNNEEVGKSKIIFFNEQFFEPEGLSKSLIENILKLDENKEISFEDTIFGERNESLVQTYKISDLNLDENKINVGDYVKFNNSTYATIKSISGGRITLDFNHPYAGKKLKIELKLEKTLNDEREILSEIFEIRGLKESIRSFNLKEKTLEIEIDSNKSTPIERSFLEKLKKIFGLNEVKIIIIY